ncbi:substrate-binding domain-containing protein (plasmid) [Sinorhizobium meliloti]|nr:substrate-binding domain-containing protein [Sinorhizobium meliloti]
MKLMGESGNYVELLGREADLNPASVRRATTTHRRISGDEDVAQQSANWSQTEGYSKWRRSFRPIPTSRGNSPQRHDGHGRDRALQAGRPKDVIVVGFDGSNDVRDSIKSGGIKATVLQPAYAQAQMAVQQAHEYITTGRRRRKKSSSWDCVLINSENADQLETFALAD